MLSLRFSWVLLFPVALKNDELHIYVHERLILQKTLYEKAFHLCLHLPVTFLVLHHYDWIHRHSDPDSVGVIILMRSPTPFMQSEYIVPLFLSDSASECVLICVKTHISTLMATVFIFTHTHKLRAQPFCAQRTLFSVKEINWPSYRHRLRKRQRKERGIA